MSPMLTVCHEERSKIRGGRFSSARTTVDKMAPALADIAACKKIRRFMVQPRHDGCSLSGFEHAI
jgi:hypothetical protein